MVDIQPADQRTVYVGEELGVVVVPDIGCAGGDQADKVTPGAARGCGDAAPEAVVGLHAADSITGGKGCPAGGCGRVLLHGVPAMVGAGFFAQPQNRGAPLQRQSAQGVKHRARPAAEFSVLHGGSFLFYKCVVRETASRGLAALRGSKVGNGIVGANIVRPHPGNPCSGTV